MDDALEMVQMSGPRGPKSVSCWNRYRKLSIPTITVTAGSGSLTPQTIQLTLTVH
jgi:hypothetical protein